jgi:hypothetical protein
MDDWLDRKWWSFQSLATLAAFIGFAYWIHMPWYVEVPMAVPLGGWLGFLTSRMNHRRSRMDRRLLKRMKRLTISVEQAPPPGTPEEQAWAAELAKESGEILRLLAAEGYLPEDMSGDMR